MSVISYTGSFPFTGNEYFELHKDLFDIKKETILVTDSHKMTSNKEYLTLLRGARHYNTKVYILGGESGSPQVRANIGKSVRFPLVKLSTQERNKEE